MRGALLRAALECGLAIGLVGGSVRGAGAQPTPAQPLGTMKPTAAAAAGGERLTVDRIVAIVNDAIILDSELARRTGPLAAELEGVSDVRERSRRQKLLRGQVLDDMIDEELTMQAATEAKLEATAEEIDSAIEEIKRQNKVDDAGLVRALSAQGYTMAAYRQDVRRQILRMRTVSVLVRPRVSVTDDDVKAAYARQTRRSGAVTAVRLHHVLIALPAKPSERDVRAAKDTAAEVIDKARSGEDFAALARAYSADPATAEGGGDLGWIERGSIATEWEAIVFAMEPGDVRGPISGPSGLHVFYVSETKKPESKPFDEVKETLRNDLYRQEMDKQTRLWLEELRKRAHIEIKGAPETT
jgi:parvulin-like peptidyl-prolyl isomerase